MNRMRKEGSTVDISIKRDGLTLKGELLRAGKEKSPIAVLFHGFMSSISPLKESILSVIADKLVANGISVVRFNFNGHGSSEGEFSDMNVYSEILDAAKILDYVRKLDFSDGRIYIVGHSQGALVGGMMAGYYRECISKLVMLSPAATIKEDAQNGSCFGAPYDKMNVPDYFPVKNIYNESFNVGGLYFRVARTLPIYDTTAMFEGSTLIMHGSEDMVVGVNGAKKYTEYMKNASFELVEGEGHGLCDFALENVADRVLEFLES